jgi:hypothetical protein
MINLVFLSSFPMDDLSEMKTNLEGIVQNFQTHQGRLIVRLRCPPMVQTRWIYMVDVLQFIFSHFPDVQTTLCLAGREVISHGWAMVCFASASCSLLAQGGVPLLSPGGCYSDFNGSAPKMVAPQ